MLKYIWNFFSISHSSLIPFGIHMKTSKMEGQHFVPPYFFSSYEVKSLPHPLLTVWTWPSAKRKEKKGKEKKIQVGKTEVSPKNFLPTFTTQFFLLDCTLPYFLPEGNYLIRKFIEELNRYLLRLEIRKCWLVLKCLLVSDLIKSFPPLSGSAALPPLLKETPCSHSSCRPLMWRHFLHHADPCFPSPTL